MLENHEACTLMYLASIAACSFVPVPSSNALPGFLNSNATSSSYSEVQIQQPGIPSESFAPQPEVQNHHVMSTISLELLHHPSSSESSIRLGACNADGPSDPVIPSLFISLANLGARFLSDTFVATPPSRPPLLPSLP